jgi:hypothetical protein
MFKKIIFLFLSVLAVASCDVASTRDITCPELIAVETTAISGSTSTAVNVSIDLEISYKAKKNCGGFELFFVNPSQDLLVDILTINTSYDGCKCDEIETVEKVNYPFTKSLPGVYLVKFRKTNTTYIEHTVTVQ